MARNEWVIHLRTANGVVACGVRNYVDFSRYPAKVTCKRCQAVINKTEKKEAIDMTRLTLVEELANYSTYRTEDGQMIYLAHDTHARLKPLAEINLQAEWEHWVNYGEGARTRGSLRSTTFLNTYLPSLTFEKDAAAHVKFCGHCGLLRNHADGGFTDVNGALACKICKAQYFSECGECHGFSSRLRNVEGGVRACEICIQKYASCRTCNIYYNQEATEVSHRHDGSDCCSAPEEMMQFTMRNDGMDPVPSDTITRVTLPAGVLTNEGRAEIANYIQAQRRLTTNRDDQYAWINLGGELSAIGDNWQTKEGNYPKRVSRFAFKKYGLKVSAEVMSEIGNIGARHTVAVDFDVEFSRLLDQTATEWGHGGSCWWQSYYHCRCAMKSNGGVGLRSVNGKRDGSKGKVLGRVWLYPLKKTSNKPRNGDPVNGWLVPTFNTETPDAFVVYNGYGNLQGYAAPRLIANMQGMTYRKVDMQLLTTPKTGYINSGSGYLVAPEEIATHFTDGHINISVEAHSDLFAHEQGKPPTITKPVVKKKPKRRMVAAANQVQIGELRFNLAPAVADLEAAMIRNHIVAAPVFDDFDDMEDGDFDEQGF